MIRRLLSIKSRNVKSCHSELKIKNYKTVNGVFMPRDNTWYEKIAGWPETRNCTSLTSLTRPLLFCLKNSSFAIPNRACPSSPLAHMMRPCDDGLFDWSKTIRIKHSQLRVRKYNVWNLTARIVHKQDSGSWLLSMCGSVWFTCCLFRLSSHPTRGHPARNGCRPKRKQ